MIDSQTGRYHVEDAWSESLDVQRGAAPMRLDLKHGFHKHIVRPCSLCWLSTQQLEADT